MEGLKQFSNNSSSIMNFPLDNFATTPIRQVQQSNILAICYADEASRGPQCYWKAEASGGPDIAINDCATKLTGLSGSRACEPSRRAGVSEEQTSLFVREMKQFRSSANDDAVHPTNCLEKGEEELKDVKIDAKLTITSNDAKMNTWFGFVSEGALFLRGDGWDDMDIRESVVAALDLAEEHLGCHSIHLCLEKSNPDLAKLVRTLLYAGFEMVHPDVLTNADPKYLVLGMDL
ncbi:hypothetical protein BGZ80_005128 [Entomortierella chlamydospora]|uniref:Ornithine decarboxylase antizyme n=1 Tax=Entomortierella chlamydospora TaxID=101097 RepID=A0A9P6MLA7_9FUNG|nr:hypothetical protein BGZ80_005128 [Entomortierella chlamydospora]